MDVRMLLHLSRVWADGQVRIHHVYGVQQPLQHILSGCKARHLHEDTIRSARRQMHRNRQKKWTDSFIPPDVGSKRLHRFSGFTIIFLFSFQLSVYENGLKDLRLNTIQLFALGLKQSLTSSMFESKQQRRWTTHLPPAGTILVRLTKPSYSGFSCRDLKPDPALRSVPLSWSPQISERSLYERTYAGLTPEGELGFVQIPSLLTTYCTI